MNISILINRPTLILLTYLFMPACSLINTSPESFEQNIEQWLANNEFDEINDALQSASKNDSTLKETLNKKYTIDTKKSTFIENTSKKAKKLKQSNEWQQALDTYNNALKKIENEPRLNKEKTELLHERDHQVTTLRKDMLMKQADALISYQKIYKKLHKLIPWDYSAQFDISRYNKDRIEVARHLEMCGDQAKSNKHYIISRDCYFLSNKLDPTEQKESWVTKIDVQLKNKSDQKRYNELLTSYSTAYEKHAYNKARSHLNTLLTINPAHKKTKRLLDSLNKEIKELTLSKIRFGKELYSKNKINRALKVWQQALQLEPKNTEIKQLINRAKKVSKKIQSLEKNQ